MASEERVTASVSGMASRQLSEAVEQQRVGLHTMTDRQLRLTCLDRALGLYRERNTTAEYVLDAAAMFYLFVASGKTETAG